MDHWFSVIASGCELAANTVKELDNVGFVGFLVLWHHPNSHGWQPSTMRRYRVPSPPTSAVDGRRRECGTSFQGAYIRRDDKQGTNQAARMRPETLARIGALAKYVLNVESQRPVPDARA
jgi:hypothetical protein